MVVKPGQTRSKDLTNSIGATFSPSYGRLTASWQLPPDGRTTTEQKRPVRGTVTYGGWLGIAASSADEVEEIETRLEKQQLCWDAINMGDRSADMEWEDEGQGSEWSVEERHRKKRDHDTESSGASSLQSVKRAKVGSKSNNVLEWKVVMVFDENTGPHLHPIRLTDVVEIGEVKLAWFIGNGRLLIFCGSQAQQGKIL